MQTAAIVRFQKKQEADFQCTACGADRFCNCNAPAIEKLAEKLEQDRQRAKRARDNKKHQQNQHLRHVTDDEPGIEDDVSPEHYEQAFMIRADQAMRFAAYSGKVNKCVVAMTRQVVTAWSNLLKQMEE